MKWSELKAWQKKQLVCWFSFFVVIPLVFILFVMGQMRDDRKLNDQKWEAIFSDTSEAKKEADKFDDNATEITVGTYVENIKEVSLKNSNFQVVSNIWFRWKGDKELDPAENFRIYNGYINKKTIIKESEKDGMHYQKVRVDVTVSKAFLTARFPLESQLLQFYVESTLPVDDVVFVADKEDSGVNPNLNVTGYELTRNAVGNYTVQYPTPENNPRFDSAAVGTIHSEVVTCVEINRDSWGLYVKCFIALLGTLGWCFLTLFISANHHVDPLGTIPSALFGTVGNIMIGSNLLPDAIELGLVEYVNLYGTMIILGTAITVINVNRIRKYHKDDVYAKKFGRVMFVGLLIMCVFGNIIMPATAYLWGK